MGGNVLRIVYWAGLAAILTACTDSPRPQFINGINFVGISVSDVGRHSSLYQDAANLEPVDLGESGSSAVLASLVDDRVNLLQEGLLRSSNAQLRLMQFSQNTERHNALKPVPVNGPGIAHICFQVNQDTQSYQRFLQAGGQPIGSPELVRISEHKPVDYAYLHDPDGAIIEVEHVDVEALDLDKPPANDYRIRHVSLATPDMDSALRFYSRLLGGQKPRRAGRFIKLSGSALDQISGLPDAEIQMAWFQTRNLELEIIQYHSHPPARSSTARAVNALGYNMIVFDVSNLELARKQLLEAGGTLVGDIEEMDGGEILFARDPDGNLLGFQRVPSSAAVSSQHFKNNGL